MEGNDENNIDEFALGILRRAKERSQVLSGKLKQPDQPLPKENSIEKIMEKLEKRPSVTSVTSPTKLSSPVKTETRPILKQISSNDNDDGLDYRPAKKTVMTCDAITGDTIVEAKTFMSDDDEDDDDVEMDEAEESHTSVISDETMHNNFNDKEDEHQEERNPAGTTPQLSKTLKKLAEFHSNDEVESPVHSHTPLETFSYVPETDDVGEVRVSASRHARSSRLSALARTINEWEDDTTHLSIPGSRFHENPTNNSRASLAGKSRYSLASSPSASSPLSVGGSRQGQTNGVRLFSNNSFVPSSSSKNSNFRIITSNSNKNTSFLSKNGGGISKNNGGGQKISTSGEINSRLGFQDTVKTKLHGTTSKVRNTNALSLDETVVNDDWDEALMKSLELQGFSRSRISPLKQIRERTPDPLPEKDEESVQENPSPKKMYFGGSPARGSPYRTATSQMNANSPVANSPVRSANLEVVNRSPIRTGSPIVNSPMRASGTNNSRRSPSPIKNTAKHFSGSPLKPQEKSTSNQSTPSGKPVSAIRMKFEAGGGLSKPGPVKPERSRLKPYAAPVSKPASSSKLSPTKKFHFGESERDPSTLSVAERAKMFESSKFCLAPVKKSAPAVETQPRAPAPTIFTSSPCVDNVKPQEIDVSVVPVPVEPDVQSPKKRAAPQPPNNVASPVSHGKGPAPPPPPPMPTTSTPNSASSKRRSTSPARSFPKESLSVKRIKVNAPKPGKMYPSLTDIETETETEVEGHCSDVESMDDSVGSEQSLGAEIESIAKACSPIRPSCGGRIPSRYRPSEDFSATFACAAVDAMIGEALEGQDMTTTINCSTIMEADSTVQVRSEPENVSEISSASLECTVVSVDGNSELCASQCSDSLNETPSEPDALEDADEVSCSEAETTASSSFTTSPVALQNFYSKSDADAAMQNVDNSKPVEHAETPAAKPDSSPTEEEPFVPRPLMHTVSFYRKQQQQQKKVDTCPGLNDISEQAEEIESSDEETAIERPNLGEMIKKLEDEVEGRNLAIAQASKALNWCKALVGFSDSTEYIECERILLIETQRRLALLNSIHRLKTEGALGRQQRPTAFSPSKQDVSPSCKGNMKISEIAATLRRDYFTAHRAENQYHFIGLVKNKHHIEHTTLLTYDSQRQGSTLRFSNEFILEGLDPDFQINLEIYYLESAKEFLPHEAKYRINAKKDSKHATMMLSPLLTPSKKGGKGDHHKTPIHSPAGPDTVKSSSFKFCGGLTVDISSLQRTYWELDKVTGPLTGGVSLNVQCSAMGGVEHKGFLTLFEDVSGYGAWVRRWCRLGPAVLEFWKYPEDETECKRPPLGTLNLHECVTSKVRPAPRDVCARANTLLLVTTRAPHPTDKDTLVTSCHKGYTAVRHLISADTRDERDAWCQSLNKALANLRAWDPVAKQSVDDNLF